MEVSMSLSLPAEAESIPLARRQAEHLLSCLGVALQDRERASIVLTEACTNAVLHAYDEPGERYLLELKCYSDRLVVSVTDTGKGFDADTVPNPLPGQVGGYGVHLIRRLADTARFHRTLGDDSKNQVVAEMRLNPAPQRHVW